MTVKSIACLHTVPTVKTCIAEKMQEKTYGLGIIVNHEVCPEYLEALSMEGEELELLYESFSSKISDLLSVNDSVLVTCSSLGQFIDRYKQNKLAPIFRIDEPMMGHAVKIGGNIGLVVTNETTIEPSTNLLQKAADTSKTQISITCLRCFNKVSGLSAATDISQVQAIRNDLEEIFRPFDAIVLAQVSIADIFDEHGLTFNIPVLKSYKTGLDQAIALD